MTDHTDSRIELEPGFDRASERGVLVARIMIGFTQGVILYGLSRVLPLNTVGPISQVLYGLTVTVVFVPPFIELGVGTLRTRPLTLWAASAAVVTAALGAYVRIRQNADDSQLSSDFMLFFMLVPALFVATVLLTDSLVEMIGIHAFETFISNRWFWMPATATAGAFAVHATDTAPGVLRGIRSLALTLFSWLLPLCALIVAGFLGRVIFASLTPLWDLEYPTGVLLAAAGLLVFFVNCHYQDGSESASGRPIRRAACAFAITELMPLVLLSAWALGIRVVHYGWTVNRIFVAAAIVIAVSYAAGYGLALIRSWKRPSGIETTNVGTAYLFLAVILSLSSPIADPARLMVSSQVARLTSSAVSPERFDYDILREEGERWGGEALAKLAVTYAGPDASFVRRKAAVELAKTPRYHATVNAATPLSRDEVLERIRLYPAGAKLPDDFISQIGRSENPPLHCLNSNGVLCFARFIPSPSDARKYLVVFDLDDQPGMIDLYRRNVRGRWELEGSVSDWQLSKSQCRELIRRSLEGNTLQLVPHDLPDVVLGQHRLAVGSPQINAGSDCISQ